MEAYDAVVLAGGGGRRLGGADKATLVVGGRALLERALDAVQGARRTLVVGPPRELPERAAHDSTVIQVSEEPHGAGPVAAIAAALLHVESRLVVVLACDMPFVTSDTVERLVEAAAYNPRRGDAGPVADPTAVHPRGLDGALLVDGNGHRQFLAAVYAAASLRHALGELTTVDGAAMKTVVRRLTMTEAETDPEVTLDCDTWDDVSRSRDLMEGK